MPGYRDLVTAYEQAEAERDRDEERDLDDRRDLEDSGVTA